MTTWCVLVGYFLAVALYGRFSIENKWVVIRVDGQEVFAMTLIWWS